MESSRNASPVVSSEFTDTGNDVVQVLLVDFPGVQESLFVKEPGFRGSAQIENHLQKLYPVLSSLQRGANPGRQHVLQGLKFVLYPAVCYSHFTSRAKIIA